MFLGRPASPGIGIGRAYVLERRELQVLHDHVKDVDQEIARFLHAAGQAKAQLDAVAAKVSEQESRGILQAQGLMLSDPALLAQTQAKIRSFKVNAEWAVAMVTDEMRSSLCQAGEQHFRDRQHDLAFMTRRLLWALRGEQPDEFSAPEGSVVVAHDLSPADTASFLRTPVAGIATDVGGPTSHSAIMARAMEIPAVVGVERGEEMVRRVETGDWVIVDGIRGKVYVRPDAATLARFEEEQQRYNDFTARFSSEKSLPTMTSDGARIHLRANLAFAAELDAAVTHGAEGVGLFRTEHLFMNRSSFPTEQEHYLVAKQILARCAPHPVVFRLFDLGADKTCELFPQDEQEPNPAMGLRSLRLALRHPEVLHCQLRGLLRAALHGPAKILLPLVSGMQELVAAKGALAIAQEQLREQGLPHAQEVELGIMIEVPSAALIADRLAQHVDFMSIGTNDLIQYTLAIDRGNEEVGYLYEPLHPAILRMIAGVCKAGQDHGVPVSVCGEMASAPQYAWVLAGLGVKELSVHPAAVPVIKNILRDSSLEQMKTLAAQVLECGSSQKAHEMVQSVMSERFSEHLLHGTAI